MTSPISFKGTFCFPASAKFSQYSKKIFNKTGNVQLAVDRVCFSDTINETHMTVFDSCDEKVEKLLKKYDVPYYYFNAGTKLNKDEVYNRLELADEYKQFGYQLVEINVEQLDKVLQRQKGYVGYKGRGGVKEKYDRFVRFLHTSHKIQPPRLALTKKIDGDIDVYIDDGRHRFAVLRDIGLEKIPVVMSEESRKVAREAGIF